nr:uncharacterized protein LOC129383735 [Dermacentor andersoni]
MICFPQATLALSLLPNAGPPPRTSGTYWLVEMLRVMSQPALSDYALMWQSSTVKVHIIQTRSCLTRVSGLHRTHQMQMVVADLLSQAPASEDDTASPTSDIEIHGVTIVLALNKSIGGWPVTMEAAARKMSAHAHTGPLLPRE